MRKYSDLFPLLACWLLSAVWLWATPSLALVAIHMLATATGGALTCELDNRRYVRQWSRNHA